MFSLKTLAQSLFQYTTKNKFLIAYSGGLDSHVLLHSMAALRAEYPKLQLSAMHIHHGLSKNADRWAKHCEQVCAELNIPYVMKKVKIKAIKKQSLEAVAREKRYQILAKNIAADTSLLTAHTQTDQTETMLLQLLRGAGPKGLAAMPEVAKFSETSLIRPLLNFTRRELESYAQQNRLSWIEDESNTNINFDRNYIRHEVIPAITKRWPNASQTIARSAKHCAVADELFTDLAQQDLQSIVGKNPDTISIAKLLILSSARQQNVLRYWLQRLQLPLPPTIKIQKIQQEVLTARKDAKPLVNWSGAEVRRYQNDLYASSPLKPQDVNWITKWNLRRPLILPNNLGSLVATKMKGEGMAIGGVKNVTVCFRQTSERCHPVGRVGSHPLKKLFQEWGVPPWQRQYVPLLYIDNQLAAVVGYCYCTNFAAKPNQNGFQIKVC